jgi:hypothetical protein
MPRVVQHQVEQLERAVQGGLGRSATDLSVRIFAPSAEMSCLLSAMISREDSDRRRYRAC